MANLVGGDNRKTKKITFVKTPVLTTIGINGGSQSPTGGR